MEEGEEGKKGWDESGPRVYTVGYFLPPDRVGVSHRKKEGVKGGRGSKRRQRRSRREEEKQMLRPPESRRAQA
jgi:hypothetical protein